MRKTLTMLVMCAACAAAQGRGPGPGSGPGPAFFPWWDSPIVRDLNLSEDQQQQIRARVSEFRDRLIEQRANVEKVEGSLQDLMNEDSVDEAKVTEAIDRLVAARGNLMRTFSQMGLKLRQVLTTEQWQELQKRRPRGKSRREYRERHMKRPGGTGEPGQPAGPPPGEG